MKKNMIEVELNYFKKREFLFSFFILLKFDISINYLNLFSINIFYE